MNRILRCDTIRKTNTDQQRDDRENDMMKKLCVSWLQDDRTANVLYSYHGVTQSDYPSTMIPSHSAHVPVVPLKPYSPTAYRDEWFEMEEEFREEREKENGKGRNEREQTIDTDGVVDELLPLQPAASRHLNRTELSALPVTSSKPQPYSYLPNSSPVKRAWMKSTGQTPEPTRRPVKLKQPKPEGNQDGGLFAEFLKSIADEETEEVAPPLPDLSSFGRPPSRARGQSHAPINIAAKLGPAIPTVSPMGNILHEIRRKKLAREATEAMKAAAEAARAASPVVSPTRSSRADRSERRSRSRTRSCSRGRSASPHVPRQRHTPLHHHAEANDTIDVALLERYLAPLGLSLTSLQSLSAAAITKLAQAVASGSVEPVISKAATLGRPTKPTVTKQQKLVAEKQHRLGHLVAHTRLSTAEQSEFVHQHPSLSRIPKLSGAPAPASGGVGLPKDPSQVRKQQQAAERRQKERARDRTNLLRDEEEEAEVEQPPTPKNLPLQLVVPIESVEKLIQNLGGPAVPGATLLPHPTPKIQATRVREAVDAIDEERFEQTVVPRIEARSRARTVKAFGDLVREENRTKLLKEKTQKAFTPATNTDGSGPKPVQMTPAQIAMHLAAGTRPPEPYSLQGLFCRVVVRGADHWKEIERVLEQRQVSGASASSPPSSASATRLSASTMSFVTSSDFLEYLLLSPGRESEWLALLGFQHEWVQRNVKEGAVFKLIIFQGHEQGSDPVVSSSSSTPSVPTPSTYQATWANVFDHVLPILLRTDPSAPPSLNAAKSAVLTKLLTMRHEISRTSWKDVAAMAKGQGLEHVFEGRPHLTIEKAAKRITQGLFDVVQARRFLHDHLHLISLFTGDGLTKAELHSHREEAVAKVAAHPAPCLQFHEYFIESCSIESLTGVKIVNIDYPLGRSRTRSNSRIRKETEEASKDDELRQQMNSSADERDEAQLVREEHQRARSRSKSRSKTSRIFTGLKIKPGTAEYAKSKALKDARAAQQMQRIEDEKKAARETKRAAVAAHAVARKKELRRLKKKAQAAEAAANALPSPLPTFDLSPIPALPSSSPPALHGEDEYATDEFGDAPALTEPQASHSSLPPEPSPSPSAALAAAVAAAAGLPEKKLSTKKKRRRAASKKKSPADSDAKAPVSRSASVPRKPNLPSFQFPAPPVAAPSAPPVDIAADPSAPAPPPVPAPAPIDPAVLAEMEKSRRKALLQSQIAARKAQQKQQRLAEEEAAKKRRENLRALQQKCNDVVRPQSSDAAAAGSSAVHRPRQPSASPERRRRQAEQAMQEEKERDVDLAVAHAIAQHDLEVLEASKRKEIGKLEQKLFTLSGIATKIAEASTTNARKVEREHKRNLAEIASLPRKVVVKDKVPDERLHIAVMAHRKISPLRPDPSKTGRSSSSSTSSPRREATESKHIDLVSCPVAPAGHGRVSRSYTPDPTSPSAQASPQPSPTTLKRLAASSPDPRVQTVFELAQTLSTRFSSFIDRMDGKTNSDVKRQIVLGAALQGSQSRTAHPAISDAATTTSQATDVQPPVETEPIDTHSSLPVADSTNATEAASAISAPSIAPAIPNDQYSPTLITSGHGTTLNEAVRLAANPALQQYIHERVQNEIVPPIHLQPPYERIVPAETLLQATVPPPSSVLLPASLAHPQTNLNRQPISSTNVSSHALLFAEHVPSASQFLSSLPSPHLKSTSPIVFTFPQHERPATSKPFYDLATREYAALQERIKVEKERFKFVR